MSKSNYFRRCAEDDSMQPKIKKKHIFTAIEFLLILVLVSLVSSCTEPEVEEKEIIRPVRAMQVSDVSQLGSRTFPGRARPTQEVDLAFRVSGPLITLSAKVGDQVKTGDVVARIDPRDFQVNAEAVKGQLQEAQAAYRRAANDYQRELNILKQEPGATSKAAVDRKREESDRAAANIKSLQASLTSALDQLEYSFLKAPFDGTVVSTYVENFEDVNAKQAILRILDDSRIEMIINIPENLISYAPYVKKVFVSFDAFPEEELEATLKEVGTEASTTTRTYPVTLIMDQPSEFKILPGMAGKTLRAEMTSPDILKEVGQEGIEIPISATFTSSESDQTFVWVIDENEKIVNKRKITTGALTDRGIRVTAGLSPGEWIAIAGVSYLNESQKVTILKN